MNAKHLKWLLPLLLLAAFHQEVSAQTGTTHCDTVRFTWKTYAYKDKDFAFFGTQGKKFIVDWGDSRQDTVVADYYGLASHRYAYDTTYHVILYGVDADARILGLRYYSNNELSSLDVSGCTSLTSLSCSKNQLSSLDVSGCTSLKKLKNVQADTLRIYGESMDTLTIESTSSDSYYEIGVLDAAGCTTLRQITCTPYYYDKSYGYISRLNLQGCTSLKKLEDVQADTLRIYGESMDTLTIKSTSRTHYYEIGVLDAAGCTTLRQITCTPYSSYYGYISRLNLQGCTALTSLRCDDNQLRRLDVSGCTSLTSLFCSDNDLTSLDVSGCTSLTSLYCGFNRLTSLDVSGCTSLTSLYCGFNSLTSLDVSGCTSLTSLDCRDNDLTSLDVSGCTSLTSLDCRDNDLTSLDVSGCTSLASLDCSNNRLSSLDVSGCTSLTSLDCGRNYLLNNLDVSGCTSLVRLNCNNLLDGDESKGNLRSLDVSRNTLLESLDCAGNQLRSLDVSKNTLLSRLKCGYNRIPLSVLYKAYSQNSNWNKFSSRSQSDSITVLINRPFDLSSERIVGQTLTTFALTDAYGREVASDFWTENRFVFQFHEPIGYKLWLDNKVIGSEEVTFTWYISVVEEMPVRYFTVQVASNNAGWGTATITGNGTYEEGTEVTVTAKANAGYRFINWTRKDGSVFSTEAVHTFAVTENMELTANFEQTVGNRDYAASDLRIYPNPNNGTFYIELPEPARIEILSSVGRLLQREQVPAGTFSINLQSGVYYLRVAMPGGVVVKKVVVL